MVGAGLVVTSLSMLKEVGHDHGVERHTVVLRADKEHGGGVVPRLVELQGVQAPGAQEVHGQARALHHGLLRAQHVLVVTVLLVLVGVLPRGGLRAAVALEAVDHGLVALPEPLHGHSIHDGLVHCDLAQHGKLLHDLLEELRLVAEGVGVVVVLAAVLVVLVLAVLVHRARHVRDGLEDRRCHLPDLHQQLLQRSQHNGGHGVRKHQREAHHEHHDEDQQQHIHEGVDLVGLLKVEVADEVGALMSDRVRPAVGRPPGRAPGQQHGGRVREPGAGLGPEAVGVVVQIRVEALELRQLPREAVRAPRARLLENV
mmetsp:Transcript_47755/g.136399  ORF Transcript_47755/g.136399 Transcript_47755/m.136399 type:complete len:314 (+) Transcript_47755:990-1931(+)